MRIFRISEKVAKETGAMLQAFINHIDEDCAASGCLCDLRGSPCSSRVRAALHNFESGLCLSEERDERCESDESLNPK